MNLITMKLYVTKTVLSQWMSYISAHKMDWCNWKIGTQLLIILSFKALLQLDKKHLKKKKQGKYSTLMGQHFLGAVVASNE